MFFGKLKYLRKIKMKITKNIKTINFNPADYSVDELMDIKRICDLYKPTMYISLLYISGLFSFIGFMFIFAALHYLLHFKSDTINSLGLVIMIMCFTISISLLPISYFSYKFSKQKLIKFKVISSDIVNFLKK